MNDNLWKRCSERSMLGERAKQLHPIVTEVNHLRSGNASVAEVGVLKGGTTKYLAHLMPSKKVHGFDTFCGLPDEMKDYEANWSTNDFSDIHIDTVRRYLQDCPNVELHQGTFPRTARGIEDDFCFVFVDCVLHFSTYEALRYFHPRLTPDGIILIDDFRRPDCPGVERAVREFLKDVPSMRTEQLDDFMLKLRCES